MGTGTVVVAVVLGFYIINIMKIKPFTRKKRILIYGFVLVTFSLSLLVTFQSNLGFIVHSMNQTIGGLVRLVVK
jgi:hypothetical protein